MNRAYEFHPGANYGKAAEALNQIVPPPGFQLRHKELIDETLALSEMDLSGDPASLGAAEGTAEAHLLNLAHEADPSAA
ncbi:MAG: hypothetical protein ABR511_11180 [Acidimicrobiales bacterium]